MAIFCDGREYHASPRNNRLADDTVKRRTLRESGMLVLSLTWSDLEGSDRDPPAWFDADAAQQVMAQPGMGLRPAHLRLLSGGPLELLMSWITAPDPDGLRAIARALPLMLLRRATWDGHH